MRCLLRNAGAMLAVFFSSAAAALAGPVGIRTPDLVRSLSPAGITEVDWQPPSASRPVMYLSIYAAEASEADKAWFPRIAFEPVVTDAAASAAAPRTAAVLIPMPTPAWLGAVGLGAALLAARTLDLRRFARTGARKDRTT
jgi:hypothetical protein